MSVFRTLAAGHFDGATPAIVAATMFSGIVRTTAVAHGSWDLTLERPVSSTGKCIVKVQASGASPGGHNLDPDYEWINVAADGGAGGIRVTLRNDAAALADADFDVEVKRIAA